MESINNQNMHKNLYDYNNWINIDDNVIVLRYLCLGEKSLNLTSKTLISCSLNLNVMSEVFSHNSFFAMVHILWVKLIHY